MMFKRIMYVMFVFITLFYFFVDIVNAYEFYDRENEDDVNSIIKEIYDAKDQYHDLVGDYEEENPLLKNGLSSAYWWPIGSADTTESNGRVYAADLPVSTYVTSPFGYRSDPFSGKTTFHAGTDISGSYSLGEVNIIAAKSGTVVYPTAGARTDCPHSSIDSSCGGRFGNYVVIQHTDGNYTVYAHMHENTVTVKAGDSVDQGQVIGKMGSSGSSTGLHLHFEIREGQNTSKFSVDSANYVTPEEPRIVSSTSTQFLEWLKSWEGAGQIEGNYYVVQNLGDGVRTIGSGITLEYNRGLFEKYGINVDEYPVGSKIPIEIVDQIKLERIANDMTGVENVLAEASITLEQYQVEALVSRKYNYNISGFTTAYKTYGNTQALYDNFMCRPITSQGQVLRGLIRRRESEWKLFHEGVYQFN